MKLEISSSLANSLISYAIQEGDLNLLIELYAADLNTLFLEAIKNVSKKQFHNLILNKLNYGTSSKETKRQAKILFESVYTELKKDFTLEDLIDIYTLLNLCIELIEIVLKPLSEDEKIDFLSKNQVVIFKKSSEYYQSKLFTLDQTNACLYWLSLLLKYNIKQK